MIEFRLLGPVEAVVNGSPVALGGRKPRAVLAILLLHANRVVAVDHLAEGLWGDAGPEAPANAVQAFVSRLRAALGDRENGEPILLTRAPGYLLRVAPDQLDLLRAECLIETGRRAAAEGDHEAARKALRAAEGLWRGAALVEFTTEPFAPPEVTRLAQLRLSGIEERVASELALGGHADAVPELEQLVRIHPLRERLTELLMSALYRCGRQTDALAAYARLRAALVEEAGLEPSPALRRLQRDILNQDPSLNGEPPPAESAPVGRAARTPTRRGRRFGVLAALAVAAAAGAAVVMHDRASAVRRLRPDSVAVLDARTGAVLRDVRVGGSPSGAIAFADATAWVSTPGTDTVTRIRRDGRTRTIGVGSAVGSIAEAGGLVWFGSPAERVVRAYDPRLRRLERPLRIDADVGAVGTPAAGLAGSAHALWVDSGGSGGVWRIDPSRGRVVGRLGNVQTGVLAAGKDAAWVAGDFFSDPRVDRIDAGSGVKTASTPIHGGGMAGIAVGDGAVWLATTDGNVWKLDPRRGQVDRTIPLAKGLSGIAVGAGAIWVTNRVLGTISRIDPATTDVRTIALGQSPAGVAVGGGRVWVSLDAPPPPPAADPAGTVQVVLDSGVDSIDPAESLWATMWQIKYATGRPLLSYPDVAGAAGTRLVPDAAARMPVVSDGGRRYTFTLRPGLRFSSGAPVTAASFRYAIERALSPSMQSVATDFLRDIAGAGAYIAGRAPHIRGIATPDAHTIVITIVRPDGSFPARIAMGYFSPVPVGTPATPSRDRPIASPGPYYIAAYRPQQALVLRRNSFYRGPRPRASAEIDYVLDTHRPGPDMVATGAADYLADPLSGPAAARIIHRHGAVSEVGRPTGHPTVVVGADPTLYYLALNTARPPFDNALARRAVADAVDRAALSATLGVGQAFPTDQYLPPAVPGYRGNGTIAPLTHRDVGAAVRLMRRSGLPRPITVTLNTCSDPGTGCAVRARILRRELRPLGIRLRVHSYTRREEFVRDLAPAARFGIADEGWPFPFLDPSTIEFPIQYESRLSHPAGLSAAAGVPAARARAAAMGRVLERIARRQAPLVPFAVGNTVTVVSGRLGCVVDQPVYGIDLARLCVGRR